MGNKILRFKILRIYMKNKNVNNKLNYKSNKNYLIVIINNRIINYYQSCIGRLRWVFPSLRRGTGGCVPTIGGSNSSASLGKSVPGCWKGESIHLLNLGHRRNNVMLVEQALWVPFVTDSVHKVYGQSF